MGGALRRASRLILWIAVAHVAGLLAGGIADAQGVRDGEASVRSTCVAARPRCSTSREGGAC
jgi:hypothetical protein